MLVVDDEPEILEIMAAYLTHLGFKEILTAGNGQEAFTRLQSQSVDLLVTDVRMPIMDGVNLVRSIAQLRQAPPIIVFVRGFEDVDKEEMYALGVFAFLSKPWNPVDLVNVLQKALADRSTLWREPLPESPWQAIRIESGLDSAAPGNGIHIGRGGFCAPYSGNLSRGKVAFQCETATKMHNLSGVGEIKWLSRINGKIGIEFLYLDESCRSWVLEEISRTVPRSFIPSS